MTVEFKRKSIVVVIPTYNEAGNIASLVEKLFSLDSNLFVLIVDDNSPDGTSGIVEKLKDIYPNLCLIKRQRKLGLGSAYREGFSYALKQGYDIIVQMDADFSHSPYYVPELVRLLDKYDLVIGSRYIGEGRVVNWPGTRIFLSRWANFFARIFLRAPIYDLTSGFKAIRKNVLEATDFLNITSRGYAFQIEMSLVVLAKGFNVIEYPIVFQGRKNDKSKMSSSVIGEAFLKVLCLCFKGPCPPRR